MKFIRYLMYLTHWLSLFLAFYVCTLISHILFSEEADTSKLISLSLTFSVLFVFIFYRKIRWLAMPVLKYWHNNLFRFETNKLELPFSIYFYPILNEIGMKNLITIFDFRITSDTRYAIKFSNLNITLPSF